MKKVMLKTTLSLAVGLISTQLFASGFALNEQSVSGMGTGYAGRSSSADDASTVVGNPAGMSKIKREQISLGAVAIDASTDIKHTSGQPGSTNDGDMVPLTVVPFGYYVKPIDEHWAVGLGVYAPFGLVTDYEKSFQGRYYGDKSNVSVLTVQPTISYAFNDYVSIGAGPTFNHIKGELTSAIQVNPAGTNDSKARINGEDNAWGYNVGILVTPTATTNLGVTYHSKVSFALEGNTKYAGANFGPNGLKFDGGLDLTTPESVDFSITQKLNQDWTVYAGSTWTRWSRLKDITVNNEGVPALLGGNSGPLGTISEQENWHDTWAQAIGAAYQLNKEVVLRAGFSVDQSPTNNVDRSVRIPTGDRRIFSLGAGWSPTDDITIDVAYSYLKEESVSVNDTGKGAPYSATYHNSANGFGSSLTYRF
ncbi:MAG: Long-chain fatty acid transport protein [Pseudomonas sp.]|jgi:long-chain fatty acid transport protein|uniref:OmpP1/FadL family transporter n=1 Tax=Pseudomonas sp. TaxID=306 RepID=UPI00261ABD9C|nr:outer membrane protein transport protein [Pseudomonas sp.]MDB6047298.1 Long-chain fatty acid transport protein [Pseudomonas sp.]